MAHFKIITYLYVWVWLTGSNEGIQGYARQSLTEVGVMLILSIHFYRKNFFNQLTKRYYKEHQNSGKKLTRNVASIKTVEIEEKHSWPFG